MDERRGSFLQRSSNRREALKGAFFGVATLTTIGTLKSLYGLRTADSSQRQIPDVFPFSGDPLLASKEKDLSIRLLSAKETEFIVQGMRGRTDEQRYDEWDLQRLQMIEEYFKEMPDYFYKRGGNGEILHVGLAEVEEEGSFCGSCAGKYTENPEGINGRKDTIDFLVLDPREFSPDKPRMSFEILVHESIHRVQHEGDTTGKSAREFKNIFRSSFLEASTSTIEKINSFEGDVFGDPLYAEFLTSLRYGLIGRDEKPRDNHTEFEAVLGQIYTHGERQFKGFLDIIFGPEETKMLYKHMRDDIFGGKFYTQFPIVYDGQASENSF
jgi:hypothetical protein